MELLADSSLDAKCVYEEADKANLSEASIRRARKRLGIVPRKKKGVPNGPWYWSLPKTKSVEQKS